MTIDEIVIIALKSTSFKNFQEQLEWMSKYEAEMAEAQEKFEAVAWRHFDEHKG